MPIADEPGRLLVEPRPAAPGEAVLHLAGELDLASAPELVAVAGALVDAGARVLRIDCGDLGYLDSSGLAGLLGLLERLGPEGSLVLHRPRDLVVRVLDITGLDSVFAVDPGPVPPLAADARRLPPLAS